MVNLFFKEMLKEEQESAVGLKRLKPKVIYARDTQHGKTDVYRDKRRSAMPSGKRLSKKGNFYFEYRRNRTDKKGGKI